MASVSHLVINSPPFILDSIPDMGQKKQSRLSGGERVVISRALPNHPHIILNDEPTVALNVISRLRGQSKSRIDKRFNAC